MKTNSINAALAGGVGACAVNRASLAAAVAQLRGRSPITFSDSQVEVDEEAGIIRNVAVMTIGPALGHGFDLDATSLEQLTALVNAIPEGLGAKSRFTHPGEDEDGVPEDDLPTKVGRVRNLRIVGNCARGDVHLGSYASNLPGLGDVRMYLLKLAKEDPGQVGMSAVIAWEADPQMDCQGNVIANPARILAVDAIDFVGKPAANPDGLLSAKPTDPAPIPISKSDTKAPAATPAAATLSTKGKRMDAELKKILMAAGVITDGDDDDAAMSKYNGLSADDKAKYDGQCKSAAAAKMAAFEKELTALKAKIATPASPATPTTEPEDELVALEVKRQNRINSLAANLIKTGDKAQEAAIRNAALRSIADNLTVAQAQTAVLKAMGEALKPLQSVQIGDDKNVSSLLAAIPQALAMRWNPDKVTPEKLEAFEAKEKRDRPPVMGELRHGKLHERANELKHITLKDMMREYLSALGVDSQRMTDVQLARALGKRGFRAALGGKMASLAEGTSDFANITLDAINKSVRFFYLDAPKTWDKWAQRVTNPDFKNRNAIVLSESPTLLPRDEGGEIKYLVLSDGKEVYAVKEYIGGIKLTRQAIINDDKNIFTSIPRLLAMAASRLEDDLAYALLTNGTSSAAPYGMSDTFAVYDSSHHSNYTSSGTTVSVASLQVGKTAMKKQKGIGGAARLELEPKFIIVPTSIEESVRQLLMSNILLAAQGTSGSIPVTVGASNPFANRYEIIGSTRLDDTSATAWHLVTDYREGKINTAEICFLEDEPEPVIRQETDFDTEDVKFAERHTIAGKIIDYRGFYLNGGA